MALNLSLSEILASLERRIELLRGQVELHARQEEHHREQRALREAELQKTMGHFESFRAVAATAEDLDLPAAAPPPPEDLGPYPTVARMVARVVDGRPEGERFGPRSVVEEVNERFRKLLRRPVEPPDVSVVLRRMSAARRIHQVRAGRGSRLLETRTLFMLTSSYTSCIKSRRFSLSIRRWRLSTHFSIWNRCSRKSSPSTKGRSDSANSLFF